MRNSKLFLITGGSGFVGQVLIRSILSQGGRVVATSQTGQKNQTSNSPVEYVPWRIGNEIPFIPGVDVVIHAATPASAALNSSSPEKMYWLNVEAMSAVLRFVERTDSGPRLPVLFTSSGAVYGHLLGGQHHYMEQETSDTTGFGHTSAYGEGKRRAEALLVDASMRDLCRGLIARLFAFSGASLPRNRHFAIGNFVDDAVRDQQIVVRGDGRAVRSYLDERDMATWLLALLDYEGSEFPHHVGSERSISIGELAHLVADRYLRSTGNKCGVTVQGLTSPLDGVAHYVPSTQRTRQLLGVEETIALEDSIDSMIQAATMN